MAWERKKQQVNRKFKALWKIDMHFQSFKEQLYQISIHTTKLLDSFHILISEESCQKPLAKIDNTQIDQKLNTSVKLTWLRFFLPETDSSELFLSKPTLQFLNQCHWSKKQIDRVRIMVVVWKPKFYPINSLGIYFLSCDKFD